MGGEKGFLLVERMVVMVVISWEGFKGGGGGAAGGFGFIFSDLGLESLSKNG